MSEKLHHPKRAFTLVELLVVIGIITVLIAILLPAITQARKHAITLKCAANLHSLGQALTMYTQQYKYYPACSVPGDAIPGVVHNGYPVWPTRLRLFTKRQDVFYCPAADPRCEWKEKGFGPGVRATEDMVGFGYKIGERVLLMGGSWFSYGYNSSGPGGPYHPAGLKGDWSRGLGMSATYYKRRGYSPEPKASWVKSPADMVAIADTSSVAFNDFALVSGVEFWDRQFNSQPVHNGSMNVVFCDGHVERYKRNDILWSQKYFDNPTGRDARIRMMWAIDHKP